MPEFGPDDPLSAAVRGRGNLYSLSTATQPGQASLDQQEPLLDQAISARQNFEQKRQYLFNRLQFGNRGERLRSAAELRHMETLDRMEQHQLDFEANQRRVQAHTDALEADRKWKTDRETDIDEHGAAMIQGLGHLRAALRNGRITDEQYQEGLLDLGQRFPYALRHPEAAKRYEFDVSEADKMRDFSQRRTIAESMKLATKYGVQPVLHPTTGLPDLDATRQAVMATPKGQLDALGALNKEMTTRYGLPLQAVFEHAAGGRMDDPSKPETFKQTDPNDTKNPQTHVRVDVISPAGTMHPLILDKPKFDAIKSEFEPALNEILSARQTVQPSTGVQPQSAAADPRAELAQRALNDPAASEEHKAAARRILGIQENAE